MTAARLWLGFAVVAVLLLVVGAFTSPFASPSTAAQTQEPLPAFLLGSKADASSSAAPEKSPTVEPAVSAPALTAAAVGAAEGALDDQRQRDWRRVEALIQASAGPAAPESAGDEAPAANDEQQQPAGANTAVAMTPLDIQLLHLINPLIAAPQATANNKHNGSSGVFAGAKVGCPHFALRMGKDADSKVNQKVVQKYSRYVSDFCNKTGMLQMFFGLRSFIHFADTIASIIKIQPGFRVLDVGSGCGTMLNYYYLKFNIVGIGIDITGDAIAHARAHSQPHQTFCHLDATLLRVFPSNHFDTVVSWAALYHLRRTQVQCAVLAEVCRVLKPGAAAFIAQMRTEKAQNYWRKGKCRLEASGCTWKRMSDASTFRVKAFRRNGFFSIYMEKQAADGASPPPAGRPSPAKAATGEEP
jgi:ubiquinone/menaquinone biosynthesis C-methylase UbiE